MQIEAQWEKEGEGCTTCTGQYNKATVKQWIEKHVYWEGGRKNDNATHRKNKEEKRKRDNRKQVRKGKKKAALLV